MVHKRLPGAYILPGNPGAQRTTRRTGITAHTGITGRPSSGPLSPPGSATSLSPGSQAQKVRMAISAGAASRSVISSSRRLSVIDTPAMSRDVQ